MRSKLEGKWLRWPASFRWCNGVATALSLSPLRRKERKGRGLASSAGCVLGEQHKEGRSKLGV